MSARVGWVAGTEVVALVEREECGRLAGQAGGHQDAVGIDSEVDDSSATQSDVPRIAIPAVLVDCVVDALAFEGPKTKDAAAVLEAFGFDGRVLLVIAGPDELVEKSFRNLPQVKIDYPGNLNTYDLLYADQVLFTSGALDAMTGERAPAEEPEP